MQTKAKAERKELKQLITIYQSIISFPLEKMGVEVFIKHNKEDPDDMLDGINAKLIDVCGEFLETHSLNLDKYQLATIIMDLYTQTISQLEFPFKVIAKENKTLIQEYLQKNRAKIETLERIEKENIALDKEIELQKHTAKLLRKKQTEAEQEIDDIKDSANLGPKPEMPSKKSGTGGLGSEPPIKKKRYNGNTDSLAISGFTLPSF